MDIKPSTDSYETKCIICIGDATIDTISKIRKNGCIVIRFLFRSDISLYYYANETLIDFTFWINDLDINILYPYLNLSSKIEVPFDFQYSAPEVLRFESPKFDIYVNTGEFLYADSALYKILRTLNRLTRYKIDVCSKNESIINMTNKNIHIMDSSMSIETHVKNSSIIIGSGYSILYAIKYRKPFIVIGERGYGGIPHLNNINNFYKTFFQGAIGGRLDGALPENLVYEDIQCIQNGNCSNFEQFANSLSLLTEKIEKKICKTINSLIGIEDNDLSELQFNSDYTIFKSNNRYWLLNRFNRLIIRNLDSSDIELLKYFIDTPFNGNESKFSLEKDKIQYFIDHKILIHKSICKMTNK